LIFISAPAFHPLSPLLAGSPAGHPPISAKLFFVQNKLKK
jgi:hypothetical protein